MSPFLFGIVVYKWLDIALDIGITENDYWNMTIAELIRAIDSYKRQQKAKAQEKATFDYLLADMIGRSVARIHSNANTLPHISQVYPSLFDSEDIQEKESEKKAQLSILRFKQFAQSYNKRYQGGVKRE